LSCTPGNDQLEYSGEVCAFRIAPDFVKTFMLPRATNRQIPADELLNWNFECDRAAPRTEARRRNFVEAKSMPQDDQMPILYWRLNPKSTLLVTLAFTEGDE
jgi:hypothetical protein